MVRTDLLVPVVALACALTSSQLIRADEPGASQADRQSTVVYKDKSWSHIGDGRFSPQSSGASDLTSKSKGKSLTVTISLDAKAIAEAANPRWKSVELKGSVVGNDTGNYETTPTIVELDGRKIGEIKANGVFQIQLSKSLLTRDPKKPMLLRFTTGQNSAQDADDQELGMFELRLSVKPLTSRKKTDNKRKL